MVKRKEFLVQIVQLASGAWMLSLGGCGGGGSSYGASPSPSPAGVACSATVIVGNHGHELAIPTADLNSSVAMTYNIQGAADHNHTVTFSPAQLAALKAGTSVTVTSTVFVDHSHAVTERCA